MRKEGTEQPEESEASAMPNLGREHFKQREEQVQRSSGGNTLDMFKGQDGWNKVIPRACVK